MKTPTKHQFAVLVCIGDFIRKKNQNGKNYRSQG
nr:MAG TPA: hypothetical protein [Caudoviricetes sp.]